MRNAKMLIPLSLVLLATGCGPVEWLNPCFKEEDLVVEPVLEGTWNTEDGTSILTFHAAGDKSYEVLDTDIHADNAEPEKSKYQAHLVRLGEYFFLDLVPEARQVNIGAYKIPLALSADGTPFQPHLLKVGDGLYARLVQPQQDSDAAPEGGSCEIHLIQAHWIFRVWLDGNTLRLADLHEEWFKEMADHGKVHIGFDRIDDDLVLTASTEEVQAFLIRFGGNALAFPENSALEFHRQN
jgi:hypothetical protein